jgi:hypothetical protein
MANFVIHMFPTQIGKIQLLSLFTYRKWSAHSSVCRRRTVLQRTVGESYALVLPSDAVSPNYLSYELKKLLGIRSLGIIFKFLLKAFKSTEGHLTYTIFPLSTVFSLSI